jgi:hypothetical protein
MSLWGNNDQANSKPLFPTMRDTREITSLITANTTTSGANLIIFTGNTTGTAAVGNYAYSYDANLSISRFSDGTNMHQNDIAFFRSNNSVTSVDSANGRITLANNTIGTLPSGATVWFGAAITGKKQNKANTFLDTILVTTGRLANTQGTTLAGGSNVSNTKLGSVNTGWNRVVQKINNDGTIRFLKETLVCLANGTAANVSSANTSSNAIFGGL